MDPHTTGIITCTLEGTKDTIPALEDEMVPFHPDRTEILGQTVCAILGNTQDWLGEKKKASPRKVLILRLSVKNSLARSGITSVRRLIRQFWIKRNLIAASSD